MRKSVASELLVAAGDDHLVWSQNSDSRRGHFDLYARRTGGSPFKINPSGEAHPGGVDGTTLVYLQQTRDTSDIKFFDLQTRTRSNAPDAVNTRYDEWLPTISGDWLLFGRYGVRGTDRIILFNRATNESRMLDSIDARENIQPGQVNGDWVTWMKWRDGGRSRIYLYRISTGREWIVPNADRYDWAPSVTPEGTVYLGSTGRACGTRSAIRRWAPGEDVVRLLGLGSGVDISQTYTHVDPNGEITLYHNRLYCSRFESGRNYSDIYKFVDPFTVLATVVLDGNGSGTVTAAGIDCGTDCSQLYEPGTSVTLTAIPAEGGSFGGWNGDGEVCDDAQPTCMLTPSTDMTIEATFSPAP